MMNEALTKKVEQAVKLIQLAGADGDVVEVAYSGGKDSDVILELTKMAGIKYRAIYKNTTIDPPGTLKHVKDAGAEIVKPKETFFQLVARIGYPNRFKRFCCYYLKEYKILDKSIIGVRRAESTKRKARYNEPTECRFYGSKKVHVEAFYPILEWTDEDVAEFVTKRGLQLHAIYYRQDGSLDVSQRLGCMCCPLASKNKRIEQFKRWPGMVKAYVNAGRRFLDTHPKARKELLGTSAERWFCREVFFERQAEWDAHCSSLFDEDIDYKAFLENYFNINL